MSVTASTPQAPPVPTSFLSPDRILLMNNMSAALAGVSLISCLAVLGLVGVIYSNRDSRRMLDRLSFRLLVYALMSNCVYSVVYIVCVKASPGFWCVAGVWMIQFWLGVTNWFILCIALNLQLVLVHSLNGLALEKYYILGTFLLNFIITLPPLVKGKFGWDPIIGVCWLSSRSPRDRLAWQIGTQVFWILLAVAITLVCALITTAYLYKHKFPSRGPLSSSANIARLISIRRFQDIPMLDGHGKPMAGGRKLRRSATKLASRSLSTHRRFRNIILRISVYPLVMILLNCSIAVADIRISAASGIYTQQDYYLYVIYYTLYGARGIPYALMALIDPSVIRGTRAWRSRNSHDCSDKEEEGPDFTLGGGIISVQAEIIRFVEELGLYPGTARSGSDASDGAGLAEVVVVEVGAPLLAGG